MCKSNKGPKYYGRNIFGDIVEIYDASGNVVVKYTYNAWGEVLSVTDASGNAITSSSHIGNLNPLRYRGYYYDSETGFYYLQSRYYDPVMKRFLNADGVNYIGKEGTIQSNNPFAYCSCNPVMGIDPTGCWNWAGVLTGLAIIATAVLTVATFGLSAVVEGVAVASAAIATGVVMTATAATDSTMFSDLSISAQETGPTVFPRLNRYRKYGVSVVISFKNEKIDAYAYPHMGKGTGISNGLSYSTGVTHNYTNPEDYSFHFVDCFICSIFGLETCFNPVFEDNPR